MAEMYRERMCSSKTPRNELGVPDLHKYPSNEAQRKQETTAVRWQCIMREADVWLEAPVLAPS